MPSHLDYYGGAGPGPGGGMLPGSVQMQMQSMDDSMQGMQPGRPLSVCSVSSCSANGQPHSQQKGSYSNCGSSGTSVIMSDEVLMSLSVRELNKRLQGYPRDEVRAEVSIPIFHFNI